MRSLLIVAIVLGVISPKIRITNVSIPVAAAIYALPKSFKASVVVSDEADRLTTLLSMSTALKSFDLFSKSLSAVAADLLPLSERSFKLISLTVVNYKKNNLDDTRGIQEFQLLF